MNSRHDVCSRLAPWTACLGFVALAALPAGLASAPPLPKVFLLDASRLAASHAAIKAHDAAVLAAWDALRAEADKALLLTRFSVVDKSVAPPSNDKHDYTSQAPYFWPNPDTPNHLPYIRKDGERNPEISTIADHAAMDGMIGAVSTLSLAAYLGDDKRYAVKAAALVRAWFLDPETRMNPNLEYAQFIPGVNSGRGIGLIETRGLARAVDAFGLLETSAAWTATDDRALRAWFTAFARWMQDSPHGRDESAAKNNHGTFYDVQVVSFLLFLDRGAEARTMLEAAKEKRIASQIEPDGRQPQELGRTNSWGYSIMNIDGLTQLATLGERAGVDLWGYRTADGRGIRAAIDYLAPFALGQGTWPDQQISDFKPETMFPVLRRASTHYTDGGFKQIVAKLPATPASDRSVLVGRQP